MSFNTLVSAMRRGPGRVSLEEVEASIDILQHQLQGAVLLAGERELLHERLHELTAYRDLCYAFVQEEEQGIRVMHIYMQKLLRMNRPFSVGSIDGVSRALVLRDLSGVDANGHMDEYEFERLIHTNDGDGRTVIDAFHINGRRMAIVKRLPKRSLLNRPTHEQQREIYKMRQEFALQVILEPYNSPNILCFEKYFENQNDIYAVFRRADESLFDLAVRGISDVTILRSIFLQMARAVLFLKGLGVVHRDLKLENFVVYHNTEAGEKVLVQLIDFGLSATLPPNGGFHTTEHPVGTVNFMSPEIFVHSGPYDPIAAEVWSLGICFFALGVLAQPYGQPTLLDNGYRRLHQHGAAYTLNRYRNSMNGCIHHDPRLILMLDRMLVPAASRRLSIEDVVQHLSEPPPTQQQIDEIVQQQTSAVAQGSSSSPK